MLGSTQIREEYNLLAAREDLVALKDFSNWRYFSDDDWAELCRRTAQFVGVKDGDSLFEAGCGAGAFLAQLASHYRVSLAGVDFAENLVAMARQKLVGDFQVADITDMPSIASGRYDVVLSHGVFLYLESTEAARRAALELVRVAKPGGTIYIGVVNDPERTGTYDYPPSGFFVLSRAFWRDLAHEQGLTLELVDQDTVFSKPTGYDAYSRIRYSLLLRKP